MVELIVTKLSDPTFMASLLVAFASALTVYTLALPLVEGDGLQKRMKAVAVERDNIRARERDRLMKGSTKVVLRQEPGARMKQIVERFKLGNWLGTETAKLQLLRAGYRGQKAEYAFLIGRLVVPIAFFFLAVFYLFGLKVLNQPALIRVGLVIAAVYCGVKAPEIFLANAIKKRQASIRKAWPDTLDLLLICVESGMSVEAAFRRVSQEVGAQSVALAEELTLTTAELSYLPDRRHAYENLVLRIDLDMVKAVATALVQAEKYGTPIGTALRVLAQESRDMRMTEAEKKAASLPPKLTVPMILFFLPVLFAVIMTPAVIQTMGWK